MSSEVVVENKKEGGQGIELEYFKAPLPKRAIAFLFDLMCMMVLALGAFAGLRFAVENSSSYRNAFDTYVAVSRESGLFTYEETEDNLVQIVTYAKGTFKNKPEEQVSFCEDRLSTFYTVDPVHLFEEGEGLRLYNAEKVGENSIKQSDGSPYFALDSHQNPQAIVDDATLMGFYDQAIISAIEYLNRSETFVNASKKLSKTINLLLIPSSLAISMLVFEFLVPLIFFRRGWRTFGVAIFHLALLDGYAVSPRFRSFLFRFLWMLVVETLLSMVTFAVPLFVSFTMAILRKDGQPLHDYMTGLYMVDTSDRSVYRSKEEYLQMQEQAESTESRPFLSSWYGDHFFDKTSKQEQDNDKNG